MSRMVWDAIGGRLYEHGVDRGVLYVPGNEGVPWNGLTAVTEKVSGGDPTPYYIDGVKYINVPALEEFRATIEAYTYPDEFGQCDGTAQVGTGLFIRHQPRKPFSFSYRTKIGNDTAGEDYAYKIHLIYNAMATPSEIDNRTLADNVAPMLFSWDIAVLPDAISGFRGTGHLVLDSRYTHPGAIVSIEDILYGNDTGDPRMPTVADLLAAIDAAADLRVINNGDGTYTINGPDTAITMVDVNTFEVTWPSVSIIDVNTFSISSL